MTFCCLSSSVKTQRNVDEARLSCCLLTYLNCSHQVTWFFDKSEVVDGDYVKISTSSCSATVKTLTSQLYYQNREKLLSCKIQNRSDQTVQWFSFRASGEEHCQDSEEAQN